MYKDLFDSIQKLDNSLNLVEALTKAQVNKIRKEIASPEMLPCDFDVTIAGWLERIKEWGKIKIYHRS